MSHVRHIRTTTTKAAGVLVLALLAGACDQRPTSPHDSLAAGAEPLRAHFNRDIGQTRIVLVAAPT